MNRSTRKHGRLYRWIGWALMCRGTPWMCAAALVLMLMMVAGSSIAQGLEYYAPPEQRRPVWQWHADRAVLGIFALLVLMMLVSWICWIPRRRARRRIESGLCNACGYSLVGLAAGTSCPECGQVRADEDGGV